MGSIVLHRRRNMNYAFGAKFMAKIEIQAADFDSDFDGYALLINSDSDTTLRDTLLDLNGQFKCQDGGGDLRLCTDPHDESTRLAIEVNALVQDATPTDGRMELYLEAGTVSSSTGKTLYLLWGIPGASQPARDAAYGSEEVWDQLGGPDWRLVSHMDDLTTSAVYDSSPQNLDMDKDSANDPQEKEDNSQPFNDSAYQDFANDVDSRIDVEENGALDNGQDFMLMFWMRLDNTPTGHERIICKKANFTDLNGYEIELQPSVNTDIEVRGSSSTKVIVPGFDHASLNWYHVAINFKNAVIDAFVNGVKEVTGGSIDNVVNNNVVFTLGKVSGAPLENQMPGELDEVRVDAASQSDDNVQSQFYGMDDPASHVNVTVNTP